MTTDRTTRAAADIAAALGLSAVEEARVRRILAKHMSGLTERPSPDLIDRMIRSDK